MAQNIIECSCGEELTASEFLRHIKKVINPFSKTPLRLQLKDHRIVSYIAGTDKSRNYFGRVGK
jgi:hypothetical protein